MTASKRRSLLFKSDSRKSIAGKAQVSKLRRNFKHVFATCTEQVADRKDKHDVNNSRSLNGTKQLYYIITEGDWV